MSVIWALTPVTLMPLARTPLDPISVHVNRDIHQAEDKHAKVRYTSHPSRLMDRGSFSPRSKASRKLLLPVRRKSPNRLQLYSAGCKLAPTMHFKVLLVADQV